MKKPDKKTRLQLMGLRVIAEHHNRALKDIEVAVAELLCMESDDGHIADFVYDSTTIDEMLERIALSEKRAAAAKRVRQ